MVAAIMLRLQPRPPMVSAFNLRSRTGHTHNVKVLFADLTAQPSVGVTYTSDERGGHVHQITLTQQQLATINNGGTVGPVTSIPDATGHSHDWTIKKP